MIYGGSKSSQLIVGESIKIFKQWLPYPDPVIITDKSVYKLYSHLFQPFKTITINSGEEEKSLSTVSYIYDGFLEYGVDRSTFIVAVGGGQVCDIAGFAASTYLRGLHFGFVPTTLLAQVDAGVGGKNGVNFHGLKNRIGTFTQPDFVWCDPAFFTTLSEREFRCGLGEVVKHALIADAGLFAYMENHVAGILQREPAVMERLVLDSVRIKSAVVNRDEQEQGERRILNFGHTIGHVVEQLSELNHGESVSVGMVAAAKISGQPGLLPEECITRITALLQELGLPTTCPVPAAQLLSLLDKDKKREGDHLHFVLLRAIGQPVIERIPLSRLQDLIIHHSLFTIH